jgi:hypothetical protein
MSLIKANAVQIGQSPTATQNFTLAVPSSPNGTIKLARGNSGATTQDVISVNASGNIVINNDTLINGLTVGKGASSVSGNTALGESALLSNVSGTANCAIGGNALSGNTTGVNNVAVGTNALITNQTGAGNVAVGVNSLVVNTVNNNTAVGTSALQFNTTGGNNVAVGHSALAASLAASQTGSFNTAVGRSALSLNSTGISNTAIGYASLITNTTGYQNVSVGVEALYDNTTGVNNTAVGFRALNNNTTANNNTAVGLHSLFTNTTGVQNTANGLNALYLNNGDNNTAMGYQALYNNDTAYDNTAVGVNALNANTVGNRNTAVGRNALISNTTFSNVGGFGYDAQVSGSNQIRIGDTNITSVTCQTNAWSDERDKTDIRDTVLGLDFVKELRPVDYKWDYREDYRPEMPIAPSENATNEENAAYEKAKAKWLEDCKWTNLVHDGTHKRTRFHHGLIAQEVKTLIEQTGIDFGGFQDHTINGGDAVMTIGYTELIAPMIKAIQELSAKVAALESK